MKKALLISLALALVPALVFMTGCTSSNSPSSNSPSNAASPSPASLSGSISFFTMNASFDAQYKQMITDFNKIYPNVTVNYTSIADSGAYLTQLAADIQTGDMPDLFNQGPTYAGYNEYAKAGITADLSNMAFVQNMLPSTKALLDVNGKIYGFLEYQYIIPMFYNKAIFSQLGLTPPNSWAEFVTLNNTLRAKGYDGVGYCGGTVDAWWLCKALSLQNMGSTAFRDFMNGMDDGSITSIDSGSKIYSALQSLSQYYKDNILYPNSETTQLPALLTLFAQKKCAMMMMGTFELANVDKDLPGIDIGMFPMPTLNTTKVTYGEPGGIIQMSASSKNPDAAKAFLDFMANTEHNAMLINQSKQIPTMQGITPNYQYGDIIASLISSGVETLPIFTMSNTDSYNNSYMAMQHDILFKGVDVDTATKAFGDVLKSAAIAG